MSSSMKGFAIVFGGALFILGASATAHAGSAKFDAGMQAIFAEYQKVHHSLSSDSGKGVPAAATKIKKLAGKLNAKNVKGKHAAHYEHLPMKIKAAAGKLGEAKGLEAQREAFKELSRPLAMWATMSEPKGINVVFCSMAKASWLQKGTEIKNPYYGSKMLTCGEVVSGKDKGTSGGHMTKGHEGHGH